MLAKKTYPLSASQFIAWGTHPFITPRIRGIIEHHAHHQAVLKYQCANFPPQKVISADVERWMDSENMPSLIRSAALVMSEEIISTIHRDLRLHGRIDQLYQYGGWHFLVDTKSHCETTFSDQLQLSFYSFVLSKNGYQVAPFAFIRSVYGNDVHYEELDIIPSETMVEIIGEVE
ncbi:PD-(D/E)XK nuclease family protein [Vibrio cholerae]